MRRGLALALLSLTACVEPEAATGPGVPPPSDACGASALQTLVGKPLGSLDFRSLSRVPRQIGPDMAVTDDYRPDRLNIEYDAANRVTKVACY
ncbi:I78 family peptidase inhibitor [Paracoccus jeotgali]|uniref:I78 family peptidase inhibitor n=1 Tax=Paracoccus jeotgali TaxID=2065379 RepID=UPI0028A802B4|nr:I78 family peptidase inhibitor [Paracoccus jeotgali]